MNLDSTAVVNSSTPLNNELRFEAKRLQTFQGWPVDAPIECGRVAKAGFFYCGLGCEVQCYFCGCKVRSWDYGDQAIVRHRQVNPDCPFVCNSSSNVPIPSVERSMMENPTTQIYEASPTDVTLSTSDLLPSENLLHIPSTGRRESTNSHSEGYGSATPSPYDLSPHTPSASSLGPSRRTSMFAPENPTNSHNTSLPINEESVSPNFDSLPPIHVTRSPSVINSLPNPSRSYLHSNEWLILKREDVRLRTFDERFTAAFLSPLTLCRAGFFYLGIADHVQCAFCRGVIGDWATADDPRTEHQRLFPRCPFILGLPVGNVRVGEEPARSNLERTGSLPANFGQGFSTGERFASQVRPNAVPDTEAANQSANNTHINALIGDDLEELGISKHNGPRFPNHATVESRLKTFAQWPSTCKQSAASMAQAGFFYLGAFDHVKCFHCDGGLRNWEPQDDPWIEHARWFPQCRFLVLMKGEQFIKDANDSLSATAAAPPRNRSNPPPLPLITSPATVSREVSEEELQQMLESPVAQTVLAMGVDVSRVKHAIRSNIRAVGRAFSTVDSLLEAAIEARHSYEPPSDRTYDGPVSWPSEAANAGANSEQVPSQSTQGTEGLSETGLIAFETMEESSTISEAACGPDMNKPGSSTLEPNVCQETKKPVEDERTQMLEEEIRRLKEARLCKVCLDKEVSIAYVPCGHIVTCVQCASALNQCPLCRNTIKGTVRIFFG